MAVSVVVVWVGLFEWGLLLLLCVWGVLGLLFF